jgi:4'-phosphopantetheinyl transferase EntD
MLLAAGVHACVQGMTMVAPTISTIVPMAAVVAEAFEHISGAALFPEVVSAVERAVDTRRQEFATTRCLARRALAQLGIPPVAIPAGPHREPQWPAGISGSITHCPGYLAAVVAPSTVVAAIGIDAEPHASLPEGVLRLISHEEERRWIELRDGDAVPWDRVLFSVKESVFKAWFTIARRRLDFAGVRVEFAPEALAFHADLLCERPLIDNRLICGVDGRFVVHHSHVFTSAVVRAR